MLTAIGGLLVKFVLPSVGTVVAGMVTALVKRYLKKVKIEITEQQEAQVKRVITEAVQSVEEQARRNPGKLSSEDKADMALAQAMDKLPKATPTDLRQKMDATLQEVRKPVVLVQPAHSPSPSH